MRTLRAFIPYDIPLGEGERARIVLPQDLSEDEAERICGVIRTLAFTGTELAAAARQEQARSLGALYAAWAAVGAEFGGGS
jgi:hypothetical protein